MAGIDQLVSSRALVFTAHPGHPPLTGITCLPPSHPIAPQVVGLPDPSDAAAAQADPEGHWAALMLQRVRGKASAEELDAWRLEQVGWLGPSLEQRDGVA